LDVVSGVLTSERLEQAENERKARPEAEDQLSALAFSEPSLMSSTAVAEERLSEALVAPAAPPPPVLLPSPEPDLEPRPRPEPVRVNPFVTTATDNLATFALDTDTASYAQTRTYIQNQGLLPPPGIVRVEEFVNAFDYNYPAQAKGTFSVHSQAAPSPFRPRLTLLKVGVKARVIGRDGLRPVHLVLVVDASGSMSQTDRMPLVMAAVDTLLDQLSPVDRVSLVTYDTHARLLLDAVPAESATTVRAAVEGLQCTGSTNLVEGLRVGYERAVRHFTAGWNSRVVLCSDGVTNVGATETDAILDVVRTYRDQGIGLTTVGFGTGAYNDALLEQLANRGDGQYLFVDSEVQARQTFAREIAGALQTVAYDAKIQVEFNPHRVHRYRLLGYENRDIADSDFRNDTVDAGEVGSGQSATALFELELLPGDGRSMPRDLGTVYVRYRDVDSGEVEETATRITEPGLKPLEVADAPRFHLASLAAEFAEVLRGSAHVRGTSLESLVGPARAVAEALPLDQGVAELRDLISQACGLPRAQP
jgi:Ca-activated chloride channel family protein